MQFFSHTIRTDFVTIIPVKYIVTIIMCKYNVTTYLECGHQGKGRVYECIDKHRALRGAATVSKSWRTRCKGGPPREVRREVEQLCSSCKRLDPDGAALAEIRSQREKDVAEAEAKLRRERASTWEHRCQASDASYKNKSKDELSSSWKGIVNSAKRVDPRRAAEKERLDKKLLEQQREEMEKLKAPGASKDLFANVKSSENINLRGPSESWRHPSESDG